MIRLSALSTCCLLIVGCAKEELPVGLPVLGAGTHDATLLDIETLATATDGLATPTDVAFNLRDPSQLWVTNYDTDTTTILSGDDYSSARTPTSGGAQHFLAEPMALAFSDSGRFATIHDTDDPTQGNSTPADFMGPVLWDDSSQFDGGHGGHLDMLHNSPLGGGIAWERDNRYWVFDGAHRSITMYDFHADHSYGGSSHRDGEIARHVAGKVSRTEGIPSHLAFQPASSLLFISDTDNSRIAVMDTSTGSRGSTVGPNYDGGSQYVVDGTEISTLVDGTAIEVLLDEDGEPTITGTTLEDPAGIHIDGDVMFVTDNATSTVLAFTLQGELIDWVKLDVPAGALGGVEVDAEGRVVVADMDGHRVLRISPAPVAE